MKRTHLTALIVSGLIVTGCATDDPNRRAKGGAVIGALAGAVLGNQVADGEGALVGGVLGGLAGYKVGQYQDEQQKELELALADELAASQIDIQRMEGDVLRVNLSSEASFDVNQAELKPPFYPSLNKISEVVSKYNQTQIRVIGHTDSSGAEAYNQVLSERRSGAVASYFSQRGIPGQRLSTIGRGELAPRAANDTARNRSLNRRVEIDLIPIVAEE